MAGETELKQMVVWIIGLEKLLAQADSEQGLCTFRAINHVELALQFEHLRA